VGDVLELHAEGSGRCAPAGAAGRDRDRAVDHPAVVEQPGLVGGQVDAGAGGCVARGADRRGEPG